MKIDFENKDGVVIGYIGERLNASNAAKLKIKFKEQLESANNFIFDLTGMDFIDSTGLGTIVGCLKSAIESGGNVKLANLQKEPRMIFSITRAHHIFDVFDDLESAISSYKEK